MRSRAETAVVGIAAAAPAFILAIRLLVEPITPRRPWAQPDLWHGFVVRASFPALVIVATFTAIEVAAAVMRRPGRTWVVAGFVLGAVTFDTCGFVAVVVWAHIDTS